MRWIHKPFQKVSVGLQQKNNWSTLTVTLGYLAATLTGFGRQSFLAFYLGSGREADIFLIAFSVPEFFFIAAPIVLAPVIIPLFARVRRQSGEEEAQRLARWLLGRLSLFFAGCIAILWLLAPVYIAWLSPGFSAGEQAAALALTRGMLPAILLMGLSSLASAILQVYRSFAGPAFVTAVYNVIFSICLALIPAPAVERTGWAVMLASAATLVMQLPVLLKWLGAGAPAAGNLMQRGQWPEVMGLMLPFVVGYGAHHIILLVDRAMATTLGWGDAAAIHYARNLSLIIVQVSGLAVSTVIFPALAEHMDQQDYERARAGLKAAVRWAWAVAVPASAGMIVMREPLVRFLLERGAFDAQSTATVSLLLVAYSISALADGLCQPLWRLVYARGKPWAVLWINALQTVVRLGLNVAWISTLGVAGLALSAAAGLALQVLVLAVLAAVWLKVSPAHVFERTWFQEAALVLLAAGLAAGLAAWVVVAFQASFPPAGLLLAAGGSGAVVYAAVMTLFGNARSIWRGIRTI